MTTSTMLTSQRVITVSGADRVSFLQGQLTQDIAALEPGNAALAGAADAKGRLRFAGYLFPLRTADSEAIALVADAELATELVTRLRMYVLRAKVRIDLLDEDVMGVLDAPAAGISADAIRLPGAGSRHLVIAPGSTVSPAEGSPVPANDWELAELRAGIPVIVKATAGQFVPQMVNLDLLGGISFTKGCYTGQEIVARMKYLGRVKRRMLRFAADGPPPVAGTTLHAARDTAGHATAGQVVRSAATASGCEFLAVVSLDGLPDPVFLDDTLARPARNLDLPYDIPR